MRQTPRSQVYTKFMSDRVVRLAEGTLSAHVWLGSNSAVPQCTRCVRSRLSSGARADITVFRLQASSEPSNMQMTCPSCRASMSVWRFQEMFIEGKGRFMAAMFLCDKCSRTQLVLGDRPLRLDTAAE